MKQSLSDKEMAIIKRVIQKVRILLGKKATTRLGVSDETNNTILEKWPDIDDASDSSDECVLINNSLNELINGIRISDEEIQRFTGANREELESIYRKWAISRGWKKTGIM